MNPFLRPQVRVLLLARDQESISASYKCVSEIPECQLRVASFSEALSAILENPPHVILLSHGLPGRDIDGIFLSIRKKYPAIYLIVLLPAGNQHLQEQYTEAGAADCIIVTDRYPTELEIAIKKAVNQILKASQSETTSSFSQLENGWQTKLFALKPGDNILHYRILSVIGEGGMGEVYRAQDLKLRRTVAIKALPLETYEDERARRRFLREAQSASGLNHPAIVTIHAIEEEKNFPFIVMEYIEGVSLRSRLGQGPLPFPQLIHIGIQIAEALGTAHRAGLIHRDVKPANIMLCKDEKVKILDFGLAKAVPLSGISLEAASLTQAGFVVGTVHYMSPEQAHGEKLDARTDVFSIGSVLYEASTGQRPFQGASAVEIMHEIETKNPGPPSEMNSSLPLEFDAIIARAMAKDRNQRFNSAEELANALKGLQSRGQEYLRDRSRNALVQQPFSEVHSVPAETPIVPVKPEAAKSVAPRNTWIVISTVLLVFLTFFLVRKQFAPSSSAQIRSIAVLPLRNLSGDPGQEYFSDGMTEELIATLARIQSLKVISRTSVMEYKNAHKKIPEIAKELDVDAILEGSVMHSGGRVRITAQLIQGATDQHLWAQSYERQLSDVLALQSEVASTIAVEVKIQLTPREKSQLSDAPRVNAEAYEAYLSGREHRSATFTLNDLQTSVEMLERSVQLDPNFADAYAELARSHSVMYHMGYDRTVDRIAMAKAALDRASQLQPDSPKVRIATGWYYYYAMKDYDRALKELEHAKLQAPGNPDPINAIAAIKRRKGDFEGAVKEWKEALVLSPRDADRWRELGLSYIAMRRYADALVALDRGISIAPDNSTIYVNKARNLIQSKGDIQQAREVLQVIKGTQTPWERIQVEICARNYEGALEQLHETPFDTFLGWPADNAQFTPKSAMAGIIYWLSGHREKARSSFQEARGILENELSRQPNDQRIHSCLGVVLAGLDFKEQAIREGKLAVEMYPISKDAYAGPFLVVNLAFIYTLTGEKEAAIEQLQYLLSIPTHLMSVPLLRIDPRWDALRNDPRFLRLLQQ